MGFVFYFGIVVFYIARFWGRSGRWLNSVKYFNYFNKFLVFVFSVLFFIFAYKVRSYFRCFGRSFRGYFLRSL